MVVAVAATAYSDDFDKHAVSLFDGKSLEGWEGNDDWFRVQDGAIVAGSLEKKIPHNEFLCTKEQFGDFELRLEAKLVGEGKNAGVQFRSKRIPDSSEVSGYQMDIGMAWDRPVWGAIYDESRRRKMLVEPNKEHALKLVKQDGWNQMRLICKGNRLEVYVNGERTVEYVEEDESIPATGIIGLQIHSGKPAEAWYRNLRIRKL